MARNLEMINGEVNATSVASVQQLIAEKFKDVKLGLTQLEVYENKMAQLKKSEFWIGKAGCINIPKVANIRSFEIHHIEGDKSYNYVEFITDVTCAIFEDGASSHVCVRYESVISYLYAAGFDVNKDTSDKELSSILKQFDKISFVELFIPAGYTFKYPYNDTVIDATNKNIFVTYIDKLYKKVESSKQYIAVYRIDNTDGVHDDIVEILYIPYNFHGDILKFIVKYDGNLISFYKNCDNVVQYVNYLSAESANLETLYDKACLNDVADVEIVAQYSIR